MANYYANWPTGNGDDLETHHYLFNPFTMLPDPPGIPFRKQGHQLPDPLQRHTTPLQIAVATQQILTDALPMQHFTGLSTLHPNQPQYQSVNERWIE